MSNVSIIYDRIVEKLIELYESDIDPAKNRTRIPNPYSLPDNNDRFLKYGYGIKVGPSGPSNQLDEWCTKNVDQQISIIFTYEMFRTDSEHVPFDDKSKLLLEDVNTIQQIFFSYNELEIEQFVAKIDFGEVTGVELVINSGNSKYLSMEANFTFTIKESL